MGIALVLDEVHRSHAAHVVRIAHKLSAWGVQADFAAVSAHPAAAWSFSFLARAVIIIHAVVILTQHREIRWFRMPAMLMCVDVVDLAPIGRHIAVRPRAHQVFRHGQGAQLL